MMYTIRTTKQFDKAFKRCQKRNLPMHKLLEVVSILEKTGCLPQNYRPHKLTGFPGNNTWECHIQPDWLLTWRQYEDELVLLMLNTGTHSDLF